MESLTRTIIVLVVFCLAMSSPAPAQTSPEGKIQTFAISGRVGMSGVTMMGLPGDPVTDQNGYYSVYVVYNWSGTVTPTKEGFLFEPASRIYTKVVSDRANDNYTPKIITYTISGQVGAPYIMMQGLPGNPGVLSGVLMQGLPGNPITDEHGYYTCMVDYGWSGTIKPVKEGYTFNPPEMSYTKVMKDQKKQNYTVEQLSQVEWQFDNGRWEPTRAGAGARGSGRTGRSGSYRSTLAPTASRKVLVVPDDEVKTEDLAEIIEDMQIMSHILDERFKETRRVQGVFTDFGDFFGRDNRQTEATYLQGYGALFSMEVNFTFSPPPKQQQQQTEQTTENVDSTWQQARQQVFSPGDSRSTRRSDSTEEYDSRMVEELKRDLITTLKHATNIRGVQPDEWIILTVIGSGRQGGGFGGGGFMMGGMGGYGGMMGGGYGVSGGSSSYSSGSMYGGMGGGMMGGMGGGMGARGGMGGFSEISASAATVLTIRAKKSDVDAFAKGDQDYEQFRQKVQIFTY